MYSLGPKAVAQFIAFGQCESHPPTMCIYNLDLEFVNLGILTKQEGSDVGSQP